jgi:hypothetical protein
MIDIKITVEGPPIGPQLTTGLEKIKLRVQRAISNASRKLADSIQSKGRADISGAGKFGARWTAGFTADVTGEESVRTITVRESAAHWQTHQYGAIIHGKPLLYFKPDRPIFYRGKTTTPAVISVPSVRIPKRFHLIEIVQAESKTLGALYRVEMATEK